MRDVLGSHHSDEEDRASQFNAQGTWIFYFIFNLYIHCIIRIFIEKLIADEIRRVYRRLGPHSTHNKGTRITNAAIDRRVGSIGVTSHSYFVLL